MTADVPVLLQAFRSYGKWQNRAAIYVAVFVITVSMALLLDLGLGLRPQVVVLSMLGLTVVLMLGAPAVAVAFRRHAKVDTIVNEVRNTLSEAVTTVHQVILPDRARLIAPEVAVLECASDSEDRYSRDVEAFMNEFVRVGKLDLGTGIVTQIEIDEVEKAFSTFSQPDEVRRRILLNQGRTGQKSIASVFGRIRTLERELQAAELSPDARVIVANVLACVFKTYVQHVQHARTSHIRRDSRPKDQRMPTEFAEFQRGMDQVTDALITQFIEMFLVKSHGQSYEENVRTHLSPYEGFVTGRGVHWNKSEE